MNKEEIYNYDKIFIIIRKTDLLDIDEKNKLLIYLMNLKDQNKQLKEEKEELKKWLEFKICVYYSEIYQEVLRKIP